MRKLFRSLLALSLLGPVLDAETLVVLPGASIQDQIDAASDGDIIAIFGGNYNQDITVNKIVRLVEVAGQDAHITGSVTFTAMQQAPQFQGFRVGAIVVQGTRGLVIKDVTCDGNVSIAEIGAPDITIVGGTQASIVQNAGSLVTNSTTVTNDFTVSNNAIKTIAFRTSVEDRCDWGGNGAKAWFGYGEAKTFRFLGDGNTRVLVGSKIDLGDSAGYCVRLDGSGNSTTIVNCLLVGLRSANPSGVETGNIISFEGESSEAIIRNNYLGLTNLGSRRATGVWCRNGTNYVIDGNVWGYRSAYSNDSPDPTRFAVGPFGMTVTNNLLHIDANQNHLILATEDGAISQNTTISYGEVSDLFEDDSLRSISSDSPLANAGNSDPLYKNLDGSQNDIGPTGGSWYDPDGWTTENPVVISFDLSPEQALGGVNTEIQISEIQAISAP